MILADGVYIVMILAVVGLALRSLAGHVRAADGEQRTLVDWLTLGFVPFATTLIAILGFGLVVGAELFHTLRLYSIAVFFHLPILFGGAAFLVRRVAPLLSAGLFLVVVATIGVGIDAFFIEPQALELRTVRIQTPKVSEPLRVLVIADLQTDNVGEYERRALTEALATEPDLIVLPGDYVQTVSQKTRLEVRDKLRSLLLELDFGAPRGAFAIRGNVDGDDWDVMFAGLPVTTWEATNTVTLGEVSLTGLAFSHSFSPGVGVEGAPGFHIVFGHGPDFALGDVDADLLIAGHTHGGQVQLPFIGPLITFSSVPRSWASGVTELGPGKTLIVSRGVGLERGNAPRMRFLCRPELVVVDLVPGPSFALTP